MGKQDLEIARTVTLKPIQAIGAAVGLTPAELEPYGHHKAKVSWPAIARRRDHPDGALVLVTAMTPTPAGGGDATPPLAPPPALPPPPPPPPHPPPPTPPPPPP